MANRKDLTSAVIISYPLLTSFVGPVPTNTVDLELRAQRRTYGNATILISNMGTDVDYYKRSHKDMVINHIWTKKYV